MDRYEVMSELHIPDYLASLTMNDNPLDLDGNEFWDWTIDEYCAGRLQLRTDRYPKDFLEEKCKILNVKIDMLNKLFPN